MGKGFYLRMKVGFRSRYSLRVLLRWGNGCCFAPTAGGFCMAEAKPPQQTKLSKTPLKTCEALLPEFLASAAFPPTGALRTAWAPFLEGTMKDAQKHMWVQRNLQCWSSPPPTQSLPTVLPTVSLLLFLVDLFVLGSPSPQLKEALHTHWSIWGWLGRMMWLPTASKIWHQWKYEPNVPCMLGCEVFIAPLSLRAESMKEPDSLGSWFLLCLLIAGWHLWA